MRPFGQKLSHLLTAGPKRGQHRHAGIVQQTGTLPLLPNTNRHEMNTRKPELASLQNSRKLAQDPENMVASSRNGNEAMPIATLLPLPNKGVEQSPHSCCATTAAGAPKGVEQRFKFSPRDLPAFPRLPGKDNRTTNTIASCCLTFLPPGDRLRLWPWPFLRSWTEHSTWATPT